MKQHTLGPWKLGRRARGRIRIDSEVVPVAVAEVFVAEPNAAGAGEANARLCIAAPDLLAACEAMLDAAQWDGLGGRTGRTSDAIRLIEAAVKKAGGAP